VVRYEQAVGLEFNPDRHFTFQAGASGFETDKQQDKAGFNFGATWKPDDRFYLFGYYRFNDPVNDSIATTYYGFTQRSLGVGAGYQASEDLALSIKASRAWYSDGNDRDFAHAEFAYTVFNPAQLKLGLEYELLDYRERASLYSSSSWYQTAGPVLQAEPPIAKWMSLAARVEGTYVVQASKMGITVTIGPNFHLGDRLECGAAYLLSSVPGSYSSYSGQGVKVNLSYRF
jgi:hypothetical protein